MYEDYIAGQKGNEPKVNFTAKENLEPILFSSRLNNEWRGFSNLQIASMTIEGKSYQSVEHYFQASKATTDWEHEMVRQAATPAEAKKQGRQVMLRPDWEAVKLEVMRTGLLAKFRQNPKLRQLLLTTRMRPIHEQSTNDAEWGWENGQGQDLLGRILGEVREILRNECESSNRRG